MKFFILFAIFSLFCITNSKIVKPIVGELVKEIVKDQIEFSFPKYRDEFKCCTYWNALFGSCCCMNKYGQQGSFKRTICSHDGGCNRGWMC